MMLHVDHALQLEVVLVVYVDIILYLLGEMVPGQIVAQTIAAALLQKLVIVILRNVIMILGVILLLPQPLLRQL